MLDRERCSSQLQSELSSGYPECPYGFPLGSLISSDLYRIVLVGGLSVMTCLLLVNVCVCVCTNGALLQWLVV